MLALGCLLFLLPPQTPPGEQGRPSGLTVVMVNVGQGDGLVVRAPNGTIHVVDAGPDGEGTASMLPVIDSLLPVGYGFTFLSHFHDDHQGGMDEVLARAFTLAYDRGDLRRTNQSPSTTNYLTVAGNRRRTLVPGQVIQLGGGATFRCVAVNGQVEGGAVVDTTTSAQEENSRSVALRLDYGNFSMWFGGDLTGGASSTSDVEGPATLACGDVDVYKVNHHGSNTSTSTNLVSRLDPELAVVSAGVANSYGHPTGTVTNRLVQAAAMRTMLCTTTGAASIIGFAPLGHIRIDTDGWRYRVSAQNGDFLDFWTDEVASSQLAAGEVVVAEVQRNPSRVPDTNGEYVEVANAGGRPLALKGLRLSNATSTVTLASNLMLVPGRPVAFQVDAAPSRNGGQPFGLPLPWQSIALGDTSDTVSLQGGATVVDSVTVSAGFPGGVGVAAERRDLRSGGSAANFAAATTAFGLGDLGTPGNRNSRDNTVWPVLVDAAARPGTLTLRGTALAHPGKWSVLGVAFSSSPGFPLFGVPVPLAFDPMLSAFLGFPGIVAPLPAGGYRSLAVAMPQPNPLAGVPIVTAHIVLDLNTLTTLGVSQPLTITLP